MGWIGLNKVKLDWVWIEFSSLHIFNVRFNQHFKFSTFLPYFVTLRLESSVFPPFYIWSSIIVPSPLFSSLCFWISSSSSYAICLPHFTILLSYSHDFLLFFVRLLFYLLSISYLPFRLYYPDEWFLVSFLAFSIFSQLPSFVPFCIHHPYLWRFFVEFCNFRNSPFIFFYN